MDNSFLVELPSFHQIMAKYKNDSLRDVSCWLLMDEEIAQKKPPHSWNY